MEPAVPMTEPQSRADGVEVPAIAQPRSPCVLLDAVLREQGLHAALGLLNGRTSFRFTGVYGFDDVVPRNVGLYDRSAPQAPRGCDTNIGQTYCVITGRLNDVLLVTSGRRDRRFPWMQGHSMVSYCGVPIRSEHGHALGTLCHFDDRPCDGHSAEALFLLCVADLFGPYVRGLDA